VARIGRADTAGLLLAIEREDIGTEFRVEEQRVEAYT
jgi:hypothetical protein